MSKPKFLLSVLVPMTDEQMLKITKGQTIAERMGSEEALCPECGGNVWMLLPIESLAVREGGKPYCECLGCGYLTHL